MVYPLFSGLESFMSNRTAFSLLRATLTGAVFSLAVSAAAQGVPQFGTTMESYQTLVPHAATVTPSMCQSADAYCLQNAVGKPLFAKMQGYATDALGNVYAADATNGIVVKMTPGGVPTIVAGRYGVSGQGAIPTSTGPAIKLALSNPTALAADLAGNVYIADSSETSTSSLAHVGSLIRIDALGIATVVTGQPATAAATQDGAAANSQLVNPTAVATDLSGNAYLLDSNTCTVRQYSPSTGKLKVIAGKLATGCGAAGTSRTPSANQAANTFVFQSPADIAVGNDGTVYITDHTDGELFSVSTSGAIQALIGSGGGSIVAGPAGTGDIGLPTAGLAVDNAGDVYLSAFDSFFQGTGLVAVLKGTTSTPSQVVLLAGPFSPTNEQPNFPGRATEFESYPGNSQIALDPFGRLFIPDVTSNAVDYLDRNGAINVFPNFPAPQQRTVTIFNSGTAPLTGVSTGTTGAPFSLSPTAAEIAAEGGSGDLPFTIDQTSGTCVAKFNAAGFVLAPGDFCTLQIDYTANASLPMTGALTFYTNDPAGPTTINFFPALLTAEPNNEAAISDSTAVLLAPNHSSSTAGSFTINASVLASMVSGTDVVSATPTGPVMLSVTNNATGVLARFVTNSPNASGQTSFNITGLAKGTYSVKAVYAGDANTIASYSPVQTLYVGNLVDFTTETSLDYQIPYEAATPQFLNFLAQTYTVPAPVLYQDSVNGLVSQQFSLTNSSNTVLSSTSTATLSVGSYLVTPSVANSAALGYGVTAHPASLHIEPANLTVTSTPVNIRYGQYLTPGIAAAGQVSLANNPNIMTSAPIAQTDIASGAITLGTSVTGTNVPSNLTTTLLPAGIYTLTPTLSGSGASNYTLTAHPSTLVVSVAYLTLNLHSFTTSHTAALTVANLCSQCYTAPNASLLTGDPNLQVTLQVSFQGQPYASFNLNTPGTFTLPSPGTYTVKAVVSGSGASNYGITTNTGTIIIL
jgi:hypothetical protein